MIHEFTISSGLKVIGVESHKSPVVSVQIWTRNGSADEQKGEEGLSHFIEHLVFKGTQHYKAGEIAAKVEACGGEINAYTSFDQTVYYITISREFYDEALKIIGEMVSTPLFDPLEVDREREVVLEEIKRSHDSLGRRASRLLFGEFYKGHPYSIPVIGYEKNIREVTVQKLRQFFNERYVAKNMFLVVTGDFDQQTFRDKVEKNFSQLQTAAPQKPAREATTALSRREVFVEEATFEEAVFYIAWNGIKIDHPDLAALECLTLILGQGASSRLYRKIKLEKHCVNSIGAGLWAPSQNTGFISISGSLNVDKLEETFVGIREEIENLFAKGITESELKKAKINFLAEEAYSLETVGGLARKYGGNYEATEDLSYHEKFQKELQRVSQDDVMRVAKKYLTPQAMLMAAVVPKNKKSVEDFLKKWTFDVSVTQKTTPFKAQPPPPTKLDNGLLFFSRANRETPIYNLRLAVQGGARVVPEDKAGLAELAGRLWSAQTRKKKEEEIREYADARASSFYSYSGRNTFGLVVDGISQYQKEMAELLEETLTAPEIDEAMVDREKKLILESLRSRRDSPSTVAAHWFQKMMFHGHPYAIDPLGTEESIRQLSARDVENYLQTFVASQTAVVAIAGDFEEKLWQKALSQLPKGSHSEKLAIIEPSAQSRDQYHFEKLAKEQTHIIYGMRGLALDSPQRYTLQALEAVLSGQGGRLFLELRDKASLAYSVSPLRMEGLGTGYFATYIGCSPEKTETALRMMKEELEKLKTTKISKEELLRAQNYLIGGHDIGLQKNSAIASSIAFNEIYGISSAELTEYAKRIQEITAEDILKLAQQLFSQKTVLSIVGPRDLEKEI